LVRAKKAVFYLAIPIIVSLLLTKLPTLIGQASEEFTVSAATFKATFESRSYTFVDPFDRVKSMWAAIENTDAVADVLKFYLIGDDGETSSAGSIYLEPGETKWHQVGNIFWGMRDDDDAVAYNMKIESTKNPGSVATASIDINFIPNELEEAESAEIEMTVYDATTEEPISGATAYYYLSEGSRIESMGVGEDGKIILVVPTSAVVSEFAERNGVSWNGYAVEVQATGYQTFYETGIKPETDARVTKSVSLTPLTETYNFGSSWIQDLEYPGVWRVRATDDWEYIAVALGKHPDSWDEQGPTKTNVYLFNATGELAWKYEVADTVWGMDITPDGSLICATTNNGMAYVWDKEGSLLWSEDLQGQSREARLSKTGKYFAAETGITIFDAKTGEIIVDYDPDVDVYWRGINFSDDEKYAVFAGAGSLILMDIEAKESLWNRYIVGVPYDVKLTEDLSRIVVGDKGDSLWCYNGEGELLWRKTDLTVLTDIDMSDDASRIIAMSHDGTLRMYDGEGNLLWRRAIGFGGHNGLDMTGDGEYIAVGGGVTSEGSADAGFPYAVYLLDKDGNLLWKHSEEGPVPDPYHPYMMSAMSVAISEDATKIVVGYGTGKPAVQLFTSGKHPTDEAAADTSQRNTLLIAAIAAGTVVAATVGLFLFRRRRQPREGSN
jgi:WD40 repeat protein